MSVPVTVVHGWLDSDAGELAVALTQGAGSGAVLLHHGFEDLAIPDGIEAIRMREQIGHRSPGCPCCALRIDLIDGLSRLGHRRCPPPHVVILELPGADAATSVVTLLDDPELRELVHLSGVVACLDGPTTATRMATGEADPWPGTPVLDALLLADFVWVSHARHLTHDGIRMASFAARCVNPVATIDASTPRTDTILGLDGWQPRAVPRRLARIPAAAHPAGGGAAGGPDWVGSTLLEARGPLDPDRVEHWISSLHGAAGARLLRVEGILALDGDDRRRNIVGCRTALRQQPGEPWGTDEERRSLLRIAGRGVDLGQLRAELQHCRA